MSFSRSLSEQLSEVLHSLQTDETGCIVHLKARLGPSSKTRARSLIVHRGELVYAGKNLPTADSLVREIGAIFKPGSIEAALRLARQKVTRVDSAGEILSLLVRIRVLTREQIQRFLYARTLWALEQVIPYPGEIDVEAAVPLDLRGTGITLEKIQADLDRRQREWALLMPTIPSMEAIPSVTRESLLLVNDPKVVEHLRHLVDGRRSLIDIAESLPNQDPLQMARGYFHWAQLEWVSFHNPVGGATSASSSEERPKPTVLAVDDSTVVQAMIKRALQDNYNVLLASGGREALDLLDRKSIDLLLLDVTMPDMDGLEMCRTVRAMPEFKTLPIIMLTARDGYSDKFKGYMVGSTKYLTKPFKPEELLAVISEYVSSGELSLVS